MQNQSIEGKRYFLTYIDDKSDAVFIYFLATKDEQESKFDEFCAMVENQFETTVKVIRSDRGGEYMSKSFQSKLKAKGILHERTNAHTPQQNGKAERMNRTLMEAARSMMHAAGLSNGFWQEAVRTAVHVRNRSPKQALRWRTSSEVLTGSVPDVSYFRVFGCLAYRHIHGTERKKLDAKADACVFVGYEPGTKGYRLWDKRTRTLTTSIDVIFDETVFPNRPTPPSSNEAPGPGPWPTTYYSVDLQVPSTAPLRTHPAAQPITQPTQPPSSSQQTAPATSYAAQARKPSQIPTLSQPSTPVSSISRADKGKGRAVTEHDDSPGAYRPFTQPILDAEEHRPRRDPSTTGATRRSERARKPPAPPGVPDDPKATDKELAQGRPGKWTPGVWQTVQPTKSRKSGKAMKYAHPDALFDDKGERVDTLPRGPLDDENADAIVDAVIASVSAGLREPATYKQALKSDQRDEWLQAMDDEIQGLVKQGTWEIVDLPEGRRAIKCKWVFKLKTDETGEVERFKARLVAKGFSQIQGIDYEETFAPVARLESWRYLVALAAHLDWEIHQIDFDQAYLNGELDEEIYMEQPEGFEVGASGKVCRLRKALYGLKQAGRQWFLTLQTCLEGIGFVCHDTGDISVFVNRQGESVEILVVYVDDLTMMGSSLELINRTKEALKEHFALKDLGELKLYLGVRVARDRGSRLIYLDQEAYIRSVLKRFNYDDCNPKPTPLPVGAVLERNEEPPESCPPERLHEYRSLLGSLMYAMLGTRPDIAFAVSRLCQFQSNPTEGHVGLAKHILRYLQGTKHLRLCLGHHDTRNDQLVGFTDADHAADTDTSRSTSGWVFQLGHGAVCWSSRKQQSVATSTFDAEYFAAHEACQQLRWLDVFSEQIEHPLEKPVTLYCDNSSAVSASERPKVKHRKKHTRIMAHAVHESFENGLVKLERVATEENIADIFTKPLPKDLHEKHTLGLGLVQYRYAKGEC